MKKYARTILVEDSNQFLKVQLVLYKDDPVCFLEIELASAERRLLRTTDAEQLRLLNLEIRWLRLEIFKAERKALAA